MTNVLLVDADSKAGFPNLALMKISMWHKRQGDTVDLIIGIPQTAPLMPYDKVYISVIYWQNATAASTYARQFRFGCEVVMGGIGWSFDNLSDEIEHIMPDYDLYPTDFSMGYTSRGCIRKCKWCVVPRKEGTIQDNAPISEFLHPTHKNVILLDNNFQASPKWRENLEFLIEHKLKVNFNQGLDIRLMNNEFAEMLAKIRYSTWKFNTRRLHFAFDTPAIEKAIVKGIKILHNAGINSLMCYVLVGYNSTLQQDLRRIEILQELGVDPYVMRYNSVKGSHDILMHLARWINWRVCRNIPFVDYNYASSQEAIAAVQEEGSLSR